LKALVDGTEDFEVARISWALEGHPLLLLLLLLLLLRLLLLLLFVRRILRLGLGLGLGFGLRSDLGLVDFVQNVRFGKRPRRGEIQSSGGWLVALGESIFVRASRGGLMLQKWLSLTLLK